MTAIQIPDGEISSKHCSIGTNGQAGFFIEDLKSLNGTVVNGEQIQPSTQQPLRQNDEIHLGKSQIKLIPCVCSSCDQPVIVIDAEKSASKAPKSTKLSSSPIATCMICGISLTSFSLERRQKHINECCVRSLEEPGKKDSRKVHKDKGSKAAVGTDLPGKKRRKSKRDKYAKVEGSVEEIEQRIKEVDQDILSLQEHRKVLGESLLSDLSFQIQYLKETWCGLSYGLLILILSCLVDHLEKTKSLQRFKSSVVDSQEDQFAKQASCSSLTDAFFELSQGDTHAQHKEVSNSTCARSAQTLLPLSEAKDTSLWTLTGTCQVGEQQLQNIPAQVEVEITSSQQSQNNLNEDNVQKTSKPSNAKALSDEEIVQAITNSTKNEQLYHNILIGNVVELETIQHAVAVETEKKVPVTRLVQFLDKQGITYKQY